MVLNEHVKLVSNHLNRLSMPLNKKRDLKKEHEFLLCIAKDLLEIIRGQNNLYDYDPLAVCGYCSCDEMCHAEDDRYYWLECVECGDQIVIWAKEYIHGAMV